MFTHFHCLTWLGNSMVRHPHHAMGFVCWILFQGLQLWQKASNIMPKHKYLCGSKFYCAVQWITAHVDTCFFTACCMTYLDNSMVRHPHHQHGFLFAVFFSEAFHCLGSSQPQGTNQAKVNETFLESWDILNNFIYIHEYWYWIFHPCLIVCSCRHVWCWETVL